MIIIKLSQAKHKLSCTECSPDQFVVLEELLDELREFEKPGELGHWKTLRTLYIIYYYRYLLDIVCV